MSVGTGYNLSFPTPDELPEKTVCRTFVLSDNRLFLGAFMGALEYLVDPDHWQAYGDVTPEDAAQAAFDAIDAAYTLAEDGVCSNIVDAPFWDDTSGDDSDDEATVADQDWYGVWDGETFVEALSYWAVQAFLATGISSGAAIKFITPLRTFRLTLRKNPHGAKLLVLMDSNIFQLVDLFSATDEIVNVDIVSPGSTLMLVHSGEHNDDATPDANGNYVVDVLKKELSVEEVVPSWQRTDPDTYVFQITPDNGTTWHDAPESDPRTSDAYKLPLLTPYDGIECDVAARMTAQLKDTLTIFIASVDAAQFASGVLALLAFETGWVGWFVDLFLIIGNALIDIGEANIEAAFTDPVWADIQCKFFCSVDSHGDVTQGQLELAYDRIEAAHAGVIANTIEILRTFFGDTPMVNAGIVRDETGTCDDCECVFWPRQWEFCGTADGWTIVCGSQQSNGIKSVDSCSGSPSIIYISLSIAVPAGAAITEVWFWVEGGTNTNDAADVYWNGASVSHVTNPSRAPHIASGFSLTGTHTMLIIWQRNITGSDDRIPAVRIYGTGTPPNIGHDESDPTCLA